MDQEKGRDTKGDRNTHRVQLRMSKKLDLYPLQAYISGQITFDNAVLESVTFIDHLLRAGPSSKLLSIKRSFFDPAHLHEAFELQGGVSAIKGVYQSLRPALDGGLVVNADVANGCFWRTDVSLWQVMQEVCIGLNPKSFCLALQGEQKVKHGPVLTTHHGRQMRRLKKVRIRIEYPGCPKSVREKTFIIEDFIATGAYSLEIDIEDKKSGQKRKTTVYRYFLDQYDWQMKDSDFPCVKTSKGAIYPAEACWIQPGQRYPFKLDDFQTSRMIKFAVTRPDVRQNAIYSGLKSIDWAGDKILQEYKMKMDTKMITTNARLLQPPQVEFGKGRVEKPGTGGRWRIDGKQFVTLPGEPLKHWGIMMMDNFGRGKTAPLPVVQNFISQFMGEYQKYGGRIANKQPIILSGHPDIAKSAEILWDAINKQCKLPERPQLMVFVVNAKSTEPYLRLKKSCDCRFGVVSQVMQSMHVQKAQTQYIGNVLMKVNAKLGGFSFRSLPEGQKPGAGYTSFKNPTMIIGADVSHPTPGTLGASMAAVTVSMDRFGARYAASCQSNGDRVEMITTWNWDKMLLPLFQEWRHKMGRVPQHIIYMRDGVSEGQFQHVLQLEWKDIKAVWEQLDGITAQELSAMKYTVIVASKRHHIRFFPKHPNGDRNNNPYPGTVVERDITGPFTWDFYLNAHTAIQGTARPVHYTVLIDERGCPQDWLIKTIYDHSYQYVRSSTAVSVHPSIYYAHLAARRSVAHERPVGSSDAPPRTSEDDEKRMLMEARITAAQTGKRMNAKAIQRLKELMEYDNPPLIEMYNQGRIRSAMWYV